LKNAELEIEVEPENLEKFCLRVTLLNSIDFTQLCCLGIAKMKSFSNLIVVSAITSFSLFLPRIVLWVLKF
jgi:hypothetical protein